MRKPAQFLVWTIAAVTVLLIVGCYHRVVREEGPASRDDIYEPNVKTESDKDRSRDSSSSQRP